MSRVRLGLNTAVVIVWATAILLVVAAAPYWFDQAFAYSGTVGLSELEAAAAGSLFHCRAVITGTWTCGLLVFSYVARSLYRRLINECTWSRSFGFSLLELVAIGLASWLLLSWTGVPTILAAGIGRFADQVCGR